MFLIDRLSLIPHVRFAPGLSYIISFIIGFSLLCAFPQAGAESFPKTAFGETIHGTLDDKNIQLGDRHFFDVYTFGGIEGQEIFFNLSSFDFDAFLWLLNGEGEVIAIDDDTGDAMGALISRFSLPYTGTYLIAVGSHDVGETGTYTLSLNEVPWVNYLGSDPEEIFIGEQVTGSLTNSSFQFRTGQFFNAYRFEADSGQAISIEMHSGQFNSYLWLLNNEGRVITVNDDKEGQSIDGSSGIIFFPPISGTYFIGASSSEPMEIGKYELTLKTTPQPTQAQAFFETVAGKLEASDFQLSTGQYLDIYTLEGEAGKRITLGLSSSGFDSYLRILDSAGNILREDDDSGVGSDGALIEDFVLPNSGHYSIWVSSFFPGGTGDYVLSLNDSLSSSQNNLKMGSKENINITLSEKEICEDCAKRGKLRGKGQPFTNATLCAGEPYTAKVKICLEDREEPFSGTVTLSGPADITIEPKSKTFTVNPNDCVTVGPFTLTSASTSANTKTINANVPGLGSDSEDLTIVRVNSITPNEQEVPLNTETEFQVDTEPYGHYDMVSVEVDGASVVTPYNTSDGNITVHFDTVSTDETDYKTVKATCGISEDVAKTIVIATPLVTDVRPCFTGPYFVSGHSLPNRHDAFVDWQGFQPDHVDFILNGTTSQEPASGEKVSHVYNMGTDLKYGLFGTRNTLKVEAVADDVTSAPYDFPDVIGVIAPPWLPIPALLNPECGVVKFKSTVKIPKKPIQAEITPPKWVPFVGGNPAGIKKTQGSLEFKYSTSGLGSAKLSGQTGFKAGGQVITGKAFGKASINLSNGFEFTNGTIGLEVSGTFKRKEKVVDLICKAATGGVCRLREAEKLWFIGRIVRWFNEIAVLKGKLSPSLGATLNWENKNPEGWTWQGAEGSAGIKIKISLILKIIKKLTAEAFGGGEANITLQAPPNPSYLKKLVAEIFGGVKLKLWRFSKKFTADYKWSYPGSSLRTKANENERVFITSTDWVPIPRNYATNPTTYAIFKANEQPRRLRDNNVSPLTTEENVIATNIFPDGNPTIAADGSVLLLWVHDDINKPLMQGEDIFYSVYNGTTWSTLAGITDDNLQDFAPQVAFDNNDNAVAVWERNKVVQSESSELNAAYANAFEIAYAVWDSNTGTWSSPAYLTDNDVLDVAPVLVRGNDGTLILVWQQNASGELIGSSTDPSIFYYTLWDGIAWSTPQVLLNNAVDILGVTVARHDANTMALVYSQDTDGDLATNEDQELYSLMWDGSTWGVPTRLTNDTQSDNSPTLFYDANGSPRLLWIKGDTLYALLGNLTGTPQEVAVEGSAALLDYAATQDSDGNLALVWQGNSEEGVDVFYAVYDETNNIFSLVEQLTHDEPLEKFMAPTFAPNGEMVMAYNKTELVTETVTASPTLVIDNVTTFGQTDLHVLRHTFGPDLALTATDLTVDPTNPMPGTLAQISATLHNAGDHAVVNPEIAFYLGDPNTGGTLIDTATATLTLAGGMTTTFTVDWTVPTNGGPFDIYAVVDPNETVTESDETNNTAHFFVAIPDLTMEGVQVTYGNGQDITLMATLSNTGVVTATPVEVAFKLDDPITGTVVATASTASLEAGAEIEVQTTWDATSTPTDSYLVYAVADPNDVVVEADETNNDEWASVGILPNLILRSTDIVTNILPDESLMVSARIFNEGMRDANAVIMGIYDQPLTQSITPLVSTTLDIPAGEDQVAELNLVDYPWLGFYIGIGIQSEFKDRNIGDNVILVGETPPSVDISLNKDDTPDPVIVGQNLTYTLTIINNGTDTATEVTLTDTLPVEVIFVSANSSQGNCSGTNTITCHLETLNNGDSATVTIVVTPTTTGELSNTATVISNEPDPNTDNNSVTISTTVNS